MIKVIYTLVMFLRALCPGAACCLDDNSQVFKVRANIDLTVNSVGCVNQLLECGSIWSRALAHSGLPVESSGKFSKANLIITFPLPDENQKQRSRFNLDRQSGKEKASVKMPRSNTIKH